MRIASVAVCLLIVSAALAFAVQPARAEVVVILPTSVTAAPGTITGAIGNLGTSDNVRVTGAEVDGTAISNRLVWLKPNGDQGTNAWNQGGTEGGCLSTAEWCRLDESPVNDGNTTYIHCGTTLCDSNHNAEDWSLGSDVTFDSVAPFIWAKQNASSETLTLAYRSGDDVTVCSGFTAGTTVAFANYSSAAYLTNCSGGAWTLANINGLYTTVNTGAIGPGNKVVTSVGTIVQYDDNDYALTEYLNYTNLPGVGGSDFVLDWEGYEDMPDSGTLQILADAGWTTIATIGTGSDTVGTYAIPAESVDTGSVQFRIIDSVTNDETGGNVYLDLFTITATPQPPVGGHTPLLVTCSFGWPSMAITCAADELLADKSGITARAWSVDGTIVVSGTDESMRYATLPSGDDWYVPGIYNHTVQYHVWVGGNEIVSKPVTVTLNLGWLWAFYGLVIMIVGVGMLMRIKPTKQSEEPPKREK